MQGAQHVADAVVGRCLAQAAAVVGGLEMFGQRGDGVGPGRAAEQFQCLPERRADDVGFNGPHRANAGSVEGLAKAGQDGGGRVDQRAIEVEDEGVETWHGGDCRMPAAARAAGQTGWVCKPARREHRKRGGRPRRPPGRPKGSAAPSGGSERSERGGRTPQAIITRFLPARLARYMALSARSMATSGASSSSRRATPALKVISSFCPPVRK